MGDVANFLWSDYDGKILNVVQQKTKKEVNLPVYALKPLKQVLDIQPKVGPTIFTTVRGKKWNNANLNRSFQPIKIKAKAENSVWHDLRGTLVTNLAEAGCSEIQIAAITGHSVVRSSVSQYLNMGAIRLAEEAYSKFDEYLVQIPNNNFLLSN